MVQNWHKLGFIIQKPSDGDQPIYVEVDRTDPHADYGTFKDLPKLPSTKPYPGISFPKPDNPPGSTKDTITDIETLKSHLQTALAIEFATIPLYLFAMYTIKTPAANINDPRYFDVIVDAFRGTIGFNDG
jgi:hypothetical protein